MKVKKRKPTQRERVTAILERILPGKKFADYNEFELFLRKHLPGELGVSELTIHQEKALQQAVYEWRTLRERFDFNGNHKHEQSERQPEQGSRQS